jgi:hypothetical protein
VQYDNFNKIGSSAQNFGPDDFRSFDLSNMDRSPRQRERRQRQRGGEGGARGDNDTSAGTALSGLLTELQRLGSASSAGRALKTTRKRLEHRSLRKNARRRSNAIFDLPFPTTTDQVLEHGESRLKDDRIISATPFNTPPSAIFRSPQHRAPGARPVLVDGDAKENNLTNQKLYQPGVKIPKLKDPPSSLLTSPLPSVTAGAFATLQRTPTRKAAAEESVRNAASSYLLSGGLPPNLTGLPASLKLKSRRKRLMPNRAKLNHAVAIELPKSQKELLEEQELRNQHIAQAKKHKEALLVEKEETMKLLIERREGQQGENSQLSKYSTRRSKLIGLILLASNIEPLFAYISKKAAERRWENCLRRAATFIQRNYRVMLLLRLIRKVCIVQRKLRKVRWLINLWLRGLRRRMHANLLRAFFVDFSRYNLEYIMARYRTKVIRAQGVMKNFLACKRARQLALECIWKNMEPRLKVEADRRRIKQTPHKALARQVRHIRVI